MKINEVKKKNGAIVYRANVYLGVDQATGKKVKTKVTGRTQKEVKQKATQEKIAFQKDGCTRFKASSIDNYQELANLWWESYKHTVKPNTKINVKRILKNHVLPLFGAYKLNKLTTPLIQSIVNKLADKPIKGKRERFYTTIAYTRLINVSYSMVLLCRRYRPILRVMLFYLETLRKQSDKK